MNRADDEERQTPFPTVSDDHRNAYHSKGITDDGQCGQYRNKTRLAPHGAQVGPHFQARQVQVLLREPTERVRRFPRERNDPVRLVLWTVPHDSVAILLRT